MWAEDSDYGEDYTDAIKKTPKLHAKYYRMYIDEKVILLKLEEKYKILRKEKKEFFLHGTARTNDKGWELPAKGRLLKQEINEYLDADQDILTLEMKIGVQKERVDLFKSILKEITSRGFHIRDLIEDRKYKEGLI